MEQKYVTYKHLKIGDEIEGTKSGNCTHMFHAYVKDVNAAYVTVEMWRVGGNTEKFSSESTTFAIKMTEEEFNNKYKEEAKEVIKNIQKTLHKDEIGYHELWNSWLYGTPFEIAKACIENKLTIVGHCKDIITKIGILEDDPLDIGVCAEYEDGERFWCHFSTKLLNNMIEYGELM